MYKISAGVLSGEILAEKKMTLLKSFCKSSNLSVMIVIWLFLYINALFGRYCMPNGKSFLQPCLYVCYMSYFQMYVCFFRLVILKKLKKFENYFNKSLREWFFRLHFAVKF